MPRPQSDMGLISNNESVKLTPISTEPDNGLLSRGSQNTIQPTEIDQKKISLPSIQYSDNINKQN